MLRRLAVAMNIMVILAGGGFAYGGAYPLAGLSLLLGGMNTLMLREREAAPAALWPIVVNFALISVGNIGTMYGIGYRYGDPQPGTTIEAQHATGMLLMVLCPLLSAAGVVSCVVFFKRLLHLKRAG